MRHPEHFTAPIEQCVPGTFEVTAADPVEAMQHVLTEVEAWQAARDDRKMTSRFDPLLK